MSAHYEFSHSSAAASASQTYSTTLTPSSSSSSSATASLGKNRRRFTEDQIKSLESMFDSESRLDASKKLQLASDLGLHPRQVAIWFQNRRARSKSKQLERDYSILRANYNALASKFEPLEKENHALLLQLQKLNDLTDRNFCCEKVKAANITDKCEAEVKPSPSMERSEKVDDDNGIKAEYFGLEDEPTLLNFVDKHTDGSLTSPEDWGNHESADELLAQPDDGGYNWWDFWS